MTSIPLSYSIFSASNHILSSLFLPILDPISMILSQAFSIPLLRHLPSHSFGNPCSVLAQFTGPLCLFLFPDYWRPIWGNCISKLTGSNTDACFPTSAGSSTLIINLIFLSVVGSFFHFPLQLFQNFISLLKAPLWPPHFEQMTKIFISLKMPPGEQFSPFPSSSVPVVIHLFPSPLLYHWTSF